MSAYRGFSTKRTPQSRKIRGSTQVTNSAGGFAWEVDKWTRLDRFLVLGSEGGTYYVGEQKLTEENATGVLECIQEDGIQTVEKIVRVSGSGRAPKNDPALFALAMAMAHGNLDTRRDAGEALPRVARTGYHLFQFCNYVEQFRGHGRVLNRALRRWYLEKDANSIAFQAVKYRQREGWTHRDVLRKCRPKTTHLPKDSVFAWIVGKFPALDNPGALPRIIEGYEKAQKAENSRDVAALVSEYRLPWEAVPTEMNNDPHVLEALLDHMPVMATMRQLNKLTIAGVIGPKNWDNTDMVVQRLQGVKGAKVHPLQVLTALKTYASGRGMRGSGTWTPVPQIVDALDDAFYKAFDNVEPTNRTLVLALDVSGSMGWGTIAGSPLTPREAAAAMLMVTARVEPRCILLAFSHTLRQFLISPRARLQEVVNEVAQIPMGGTDCALPMLEAARQDIPVDAFTIYTDSETWYGNIHPSQALQEYRNKHNKPNAKLIVVGMMSNGFSIADPNDLGMLDVVGFDTSSPAVMEDFIRE